MASIAMMLAIALEPQHGLLIHYSIHIFNVGLFTTNGTRTHSKTRLMPMPSPVVIRP